MKVEIKQNDTLVAHADIYKGLISNVFVEPQYRRRGYGNELIKKCINVCIRPYLYVEKSNESALNLYIKNGFKIKESFTIRGETICRMELNRSIK